MGEKPDSRGRSDDAGSAPPVVVERLLEMSDGTTHGLRELVGLYLEAVDEDFAEMREALARAEAGDLEQASHRAGGSSWACGAQALAAVLRDVERLARERRLGEAEAMVARAAAEQGRVRRFLLRYVEQS